MKIRFGTFETNSSSTHSLILYNKDFYDDAADYLYQDPRPEPLKAGMTYNITTVEVYRQPYGLVSPIEKLTYIYTEHVTLSKESDGYDDTAFKQLVEKLEKAYDCKFEFTDLEDYTFHAFYLIDEPDVDVLFEIVTNDRYAIIIDSDEVPWFFVDECYEGSEDPTEVNSNITGFKVLYGLNDFWEDSKD